MTGEAQDIVSGDGISLSYESGIDLGSMLLTLARYAFVTLIVLLVFWAFMHLLRRMLERTSGLRGQGRIRVVESARLSGDKLIHIVRVDEKEVLIGSSRENLSFLGELEGPPAELPQAEQVDDAGLECDRAPKDYVQRLGEALRGIPSLAGRAWSLLSERAAGWTSQAKTALAKLRVNRPGHQAGVVSDVASEETEILRDGARRVGESTRKFREVLSEEVAASKDDANPEDHSSRLERLRSLAAKAERRDDLD